MLFFWARHRERDEERRAERVRSVAAAPRRRSFPAAKRREPRLHESKLASRAAARTIPRRARRAARVRADRIPAPNLRLGSPRVAPIGDGTAAEERARSHPRAPPRAGDSTRASGRVPAERTGAASHARFRRAPRVLARSPPDRAMTSPLIANPRARPRLATKFSPIPPLRPPLLRKLRLSSSLPAPPPAPRSSPRLPPRSSPPPSPPPSPPSPPPPPSPRRR